jgi:hypothetical protein
LCSRAEDGRGPSAEQNNSRASTARPKKKSSVGGCPVGKEDHEDELQAFIRILEEGV